MHWYYYLSYFFGGAFLANSLPHLINGVSGRAFQSPFAKPPGKGLSSSTVNVLWGFFNLAVAYVLCFAWAVSAFTTSGRRSRSAQAFWSCRSCSPAPSGALHGGLQA